MYVCGCLDLMLVDVHKVMQSKDREREWERENHTELLEKATTHYYYTQPKVWE